ncbi:hypothetical protein QCM8_270 [Bacillus phage QCM8]|nr:hypothetical protein QCM8_270 [Bacillus phage QCM8]UGO49333.1 hypothetical protein EMILIAHAH_247 [Bacillus phage vB_BanH_Emiliahah]
MAVSTLDFTNTFKNITVKVGDVFLYNGSYYEITNIYYVGRALHGFRVKGTSRRIRSPFETKDGATLLTPAF